MPGPQKYAKVERYFAGDRRRHAAATAPAPSRESRALAEQNRQTAAGIFSTGASAMALANSKRPVRQLSPDARRIFRHHDGAATPPAGPRPTHPISAASIPRRWPQRASQKAAASRHPREVEPGRWTVILEPSAVLDLVGFLFYDFAGTAVLDQRSCFNKRMGKKVMGENITIHDDVTHPLQSGPPFDGEGMPRQKVLLVDRGVPRNLVYARSTAKKMKAKPTGHGLPLPNARRRSARSIWFSTAAIPPLDEMVASTDRGILLTRLWYIREVDPYEKVLTGMTRDGSFLVENGRIVRRHPQFPLQPEYSRDAVERRADGSRRARRRRRVLRDGRSGHEGPQLPLHRSDQILMMFTI